jgi:hypothetical protein
MAVAEKKAWAVDAITAAPIKQTVPLWAFLLIDNHRCGGRAAAGMKRKKAG